MFSTVWNALKGFYQIRSSKSLEFMDSKVFFIQFFILYNSVGGGVTSKVKLMRVGGWYGGMR